MTEATSSIISGHSNQGGVVDGQTPILEAPKQIGPYVIETEIGRGAHGVVYRALHASRPETPVALKVVESRGQPDKLLIEPQILSKLNHPGIVRLHDYFMHGQDMIVVMELIQGVELKAFSESLGPLSAAAVRDFLTQISSALEHAHTAGVLHRDLKPSNILVEQSGEKVRYVLTDFGVSRMSEGIQVTKHTGGTYHFMAPEQLRGRPGPQSDLWALGVIAYQMLTRQLPFSGHTVQELSHSIFFTTPVPPSQLAPKFADDELERIVFDLLEKLVNERSSSATELLSALGGRSNVHAAPFEPLPTSINKTTYSYNVERQIGRLWGWFWFVLVLQAIPNGIVPSILAYAGLFTFFKGQKSVTFWQRGYLEVGAIALLLLSWAGTWIVIGAFPLFGAFGFVIGNLLTILTYPIAISCVAKIRRLQRGMELRRAITESTAGTDVFLNRLRSYVDIYPGDTNFRQKYVEALLACGRTQEAVVESKLMIESDPYNVGVNLLLAHAYYQVGLYVQCVAVCDAYLAVTGYCFEFTELKVDCARAITTARTGANAAETSSGTPILGATP